MLSCLFQNEMIATCRSNIQCLQIIKINISIGPQQVAEGGSQVTATTASAAPAQNPAIPSAEQLILQLMDRWNRLLGDIESRGQTMLNEDARHVVLGGANAKDKGGNETTPQRSSPLKTPRRVLDGATVREDILKLREEMLQMEGMHRELDHEQNGDKSQGFADIDERVSVLKVFN